MDRNWHTVQIQLISRCLKLMMSWLTFPPPEAAILKEDSGFGATKLMSGQVTGLQSK
jgi:hypothetical protein